MKKFLLLCILVAFILLSACDITTYISAYENNILNSLGSYETKEFYTSGGFQDYTDYAKYTYNSLY